MRSQKNGGAVVGNSSLFFGRIATDDQAAFYMDAHGINLSAADLLAADAMIAVNDFDIFITVIGIVAIDETVVVLRRRNF